MAMTCSGLLTRTHSTTSQPPRTATCWPCWSVASHEHKETITSERGMVPNRRRTLLRPRLQRTREMHFEEDELSSVECLHLERKSKHVAAKCCKTLVKASIGGWGHIWYCILAKFVPDDKRANFYSAFISWLPLMVLSLYFIFNTLIIIIIEH